MTLETFEPPKAYEPKNKNTLESLRHSIIEPKLDGVRGIIHCTPKGVFILSRRTNKNGEYSQFQDNVPHLKTHPWLINLGKTATTILDCEVIAPADTDTLAKTMSIIGSKSEKAIKLQENTGKAQIVIFDMPQIVGKSLKETAWRTRRRILENTIQKTLDSKDPYIFLIEYSETSNIEKRKTIVDTYIKNGFEGVVLKDPNATYTASRAWLKHKIKTTIDAQITGWIPGKGKYLNNIGALKVSIIKNGNLQFLCTVAPGTDYKRTQLYNELKTLSPKQIIDKKLIVELEGQELTKDESIRHPRILRYRDDKDTPDHYIQQKETTEPTNTRTN